MWRDKKPKKSRKDTNKPYFKSKFTTDPTINYHCSGDFLTVILINKLTAS